MISLRRRFFNVFYRNKATIISSLLAVSILLLIKRTILNIPSSISTIHLRKRSLLIETSNIHRNKTSSDNQLHCFGQVRPVLTEMVLFQNVWQVQHDNQTEAFLYSAHYDDRPLGGPLPYVRVLALAMLPYHKQNAFCHLWFDMQQYPLIVSARIAYTGINPYLYKGQYYKEYTINCPLPNALHAPAYVTITHTKCGNNSNYLPVQYDDHITPRFDFGLCAANGHGYFRPEEMIEWFELNLLFGVSEINLYDTMYANQSLVFQHYLSRGVLHLSPLPHPFGQSGNWYSKTRNLRTTAFNDCLLRNRNKYKYIVVVDHDEVIVPRNHSNYRQLLQSVSERHHKEHVYSYLFRNTYFFKEFGPDKNKPRYLKTLQYRYRAKPCANTYMAPKVILDPSFCFNLFNHYCYTRLSLYRGPVSWFVKPEEAASHHYRVCQKDYPCKQYFREKTLDDVMLKYETVLQDRVLSVLKHLNLSINFL